MGSRAIVFDLGGVLVDWDPRYLYRRLFGDDAQAMERFLAEVCTSDWNRQQDAGRPFAQGVAELVARHPEHEVLIRAYDTRWEEMIAGPIVPSVEILKALKHTGHALHALSNWSSEKFALVRPKYEFFDWFDGILISGDVKLIKPDPKIFALLLQRMDRVAEECIFIDDLEVNVEAARELGFETIHFRSPAQLAGELAVLKLL
jgi:2-haloacid dehalogenase